eukprot:tig00021035_g17251.t1
MRSCAASARPATAAEFEPAGALGSGLIPALDALRARRAAAGERFVLHVAVLPEGAAAPGATAPAELAAGRTGSAEDAVLAADDGDTLAFAPGTHRVLGEVRVTTLTTLEGASAAVSDVVLQLAPEASVLLSLGMAPGRMPDVPRAPHARGVQTAAVGGELRRLAFRCKPGGTPALRVRSGGWRLHECIVDAGGRPFCLEVGGSRTPSAAAAASAYVASQLRAAKGGGDSTTHGLVAPAWAAAWVEACTLGRGGAGAVRAWPGAMLFMATSLASACGGRPVRIGAAPAGGTVAEGLEVPASAQGRSGRRISLAGGPGSAYSSAASTQATGCEVDVSESAAAGCGGREGPALRGDSTGAFVGGTAAPRDRISVTRSLILPRAATELEAARAGWGPAAVR